MADNSYSEKVTAKVQLNLSDFMNKMMEADAELGSVAAGPDIKREGSNTGFAQAGDAMIDAAMDQMEDFVTEVMARSNLEVPKDTEVLMRSARPLVVGMGRQYTQGDNEAGVAKLAGNNIEVEFGYGYGSELNPRTGRLADQYALPVHEIYEAKHEPPTKSHYLIDPLIEHSGDLGIELKIAMTAGAKRSIAGLKVNRSVFLFRKGGGKGINPVFGPQGIIKRKRG